MTQCQCKEKSGLHKSYGSKGSRTIVIHEAILGWRWIVTPNFYFTFWYGNDVIFAFSLYYWTYLLQCHNNFLNRASDSFVATTLALCFSFKATMLVTVFLIRVLNTIVNKHVEKPYLPDCQIKFHISFWSIICKTYHKYYKRSLQKHNTALL